MGPRMLRLYALTVLYDPTLLLARDLIKALTWRDCVWEPTPCKTSIFSLTAKIHPISGYQVGVQGCFGDELGNEDGEEG